MSENLENNWPKFDVTLWKNIPVISDRIATENDAKNGLAVFCLRNTDSEHKMFEIDLPKLAKLIDEDSNEKLIVAIQAEQTKQGIDIGYRIPEGGNGACLLHELKFLDEQEIEEVLSKASS